MMRRLGFLGAALLGLAGCDGGSMETDSSKLADAGSDAPITVVLDAGGDAATPPDGASACPTGVCNYQTGAGCPPSAPACIPEPSGSTVVPACTAAGTAAGGAACTKADDCVPGYLCAEGSCRKLCCGGDWTGCDKPSEHCIKTLQYGDGNGGVLATGAMLCYPVDTCDALSPGSCSEAGQTCQIADATGATACLPEGTGTSGQACPCKGGFVCVNGSGGPLCRRLCKAVEGGAAPYCQEGEGTCTHYSRDPDGVGECTP